jgi:hypothetical protein
MGDITVGEHHLVDGFVADEVFEFDLGTDKDAIGVARPCSSPGRCGDLSRGSVWR